MSFAATWKTHPFVKITPAFISGILLQWYLQLSLTVIFVPAMVAALMLFAGCWLPAAGKYAFRWLQGLLIMLLIAATGAVWTYSKTSLHQPGWLGNNNAATAIRATIEEPLTEKPKTYKTTARITAVRNADGSWVKQEGKIIVYIRKKDSIPPLHYGVQILFSKTVQPIRNSGNPGAFNYQQYCAFQHIYHQVMLGEEEYVLLPGNDGSRLQQWLYSCRRRLINILQKNIPGTVEQGVAEALLIGYRDDLDKTLLQSYNNTGVVHIIAISGLHLGMIYSIMAAFFSLLPGSRRHTLYKGILLLTIIWLFTLLAGAAPSILRAAVMFSFIITAGILQRKNSICNSLAASACCLLLYDPFYLWDLGFQLSYAAVLSIVLFRKPVYNWCKVNNKLLNSLWQLLSVTLAAQVLTLPVVLFYFHRFPLFVLFSNMVAVPLSGLVLYVELLLLMVCWWAAAAHYAGLLLYWLIKLLNAFIVHMNSIPYAAITQVQLNTAQVILAYLCIMAVYSWLGHKNKKAFWVACCSLLLMIAVTASQKQKNMQQQKLVVYNINRQAAAEIIQGTNAGYWGDSTVLGNQALVQNYLLPAHTQWQVQKARLLRNHVYTCNGKKILFCTTPVLPAAGRRLLAVDILVVSGNPALSVMQLQACFTCKQLVFDSSNPLWKIEKWKKACDSLHLRFHSVPEQGAFIADL